MRVSEAILARRTAHTFEPRRVPAGVLDDVLRAGMRAPSARNWQPWRFIVVHDGPDKTFLHELAIESKEISAWWVPMFRPEGLREYIQDLEHTPVTIHGEATHIIAAGRCAQNMALMAPAVGLGSVFLSHLSHEKAKAALGIPYELDLAGVMAFGYPAEAPRSERLERAKLVYDGGFESRKGFTGVGVRHSGMREALAEYGVWRKRQEGRPGGKSRSGLGEDRMLGPRPK